MPGARSEAGGVDNPLVLDSSDSDDNLSGLPLNGRVKRIDGNDRSYKKKSLTSMRKSTVVDLTLSDSDEAVDSVNLLPGLSSTPGRAAQAGISDEQPSLRRRPRPFMSIADSSSPPENQNVISFLGNHSQEIGELPSPPLVEDRAAPNKMELGGENIVGQNNEANAAQAAVPVSGTPSLTLSSNRPQSVSGAQLVVASSSRSAINSPPRRTPSIPQQSSSSRATPCRSANIASSPSRPPTPPLPATQSTPVTVSRRLASPILSPVQAVSSAIISPTIPSIPSHASLSDPTILSPPSATSALPNSSIPSTSTTVQTPAAALTYARPSTSAAPLPVMPISVTPATTSPAGPGPSTLQSASEATKSSDQKESPRKTNSKQPSSPSSTHGRWTDTRLFHTPSNLSATSGKSSAASSRSKSRAPLSSRAAMSDNVAGPSKTASVSSTHPPTRASSSSLPSQSQRQVHPRPPSRDGVGKREKKSKTLSSGTGQSTPSKFSLPTSDVASNQKNKSTGLNALPKKPSSTPTSSIPQRTSTLATAMAIRPFVRSPTPPSPQSSSEASRSIQTSRGAVKAAQNQDKIHPLSTASSISSHSREATTKATTLFHTTSSPPSPSQSTSAPTKSHVVWNAQKLGTTVLSSERIHPSRGKSQTSDSVVAPAASQAAASLSYPAGTSGGAREADKKAVETSFHAGPSSADFEAFVLASTSAIAPTTVPPSVAPPEDAPVLKSGSIIHPLFRAASAIGDQNAFTKTEAVGDVLSQGSKGRASSPRITTTGAVSHLAPHVDLGSKIKPTAAPSLFASGVTTKNVDDQDSAQPQNQTPLPSAISVSSKMNHGSLSKESSIKSAASFISSSSTLGDSVSGLGRKSHHKSTQSMPQSPLPTTNTNNSSGIEVNSWLNPQPFGPSFAASHLSTHAKKKWKEREREKEREKEKVREKEKAKEENEQLRQKRIADLEKLSANLELYKRRMDVESRTRSIPRADGETRKRPPSPGISVSTDAEVRVVKRSKPTWAIAPEGGHVAAAMEKESANVNKKAADAIKINHQPASSYAPAFATPASSAKATTTPLSVTAGLGPPVNSSSSTSTPSLLSRSINLGILREKPKEHMDDDDGDDSAGGLPVRKTGKNGAVEEQVEQVRLDLDDVSIHGSSPAAPLSIFTSRFRDVSITPSRIQKTLEESDSDVPIQRYAVKVNGKQKAQRSKDKSYGSESEDDVPLNWPSRKGKGRTAPEPQDSSETQRDDDDVNLGSGDGEERPSDDDSIPVPPSPLFKDRTAHVRQPLQTLFKGGIVAKHSYQRPLAKASAVSPVPSANRPSPAPSAKADLLPQKRKRRFKKITSQQWQHIAQNSLSDVDDLLGESSKKRLSPENAEKLGADLSKLTRPRVFSIVSRSEPWTKREPIEEDNNEYFTDSDSHTSDVALFSQHPDPPPPPERIREAKRNFDTRNIDPWNRQKHTFRSNPALHRAIFEAYIMQSTSMEESGGDDIKVTNDVDADGGPPDFEFVYSDTMLYPDGIPPPELGLGCDCDGPCDPDSETCTCVKRQELYFYDLGLKGFAYDENGKIRENSASIWECNELCGCPPECMNRVIQRGRARDTGIEIFKTKEKGWGIRARSFIPSGTYIGSYTGELIREAESERRGVTYTAIGRTYVFDLDGWQIRHPPKGLEKIDKRAAELAEAVKMRARAAMRESQEDAYNAYSVDAFHYGFTRYFNHSCDPNLAITQAYVKDFHPERPLLVIFTRRDIKKHEELCISYKGIPDDDDIPSPEPVKKKKGGKGKKQMSKTSASAHPPEMMALNSDKGLVEVKDICRW
ncbi:hypothetical protein LQV05_001651 [Cryptococcus neoformans]|nr:hypothetical protein LQV05_001651 [Cryptococcus neoformans]